MSFKDALRETDEYQALASQSNGDGDEGQPANDVVPESVAPIVSLEKTDMEFWMQVVTVLLLFLIYRELSRANQAAIAQGLANGVSA